MIQKSIIKDIGKRKNTGSFDRRDMKVLSVKMMTAFSPSQILKTFKERVEEIYQFYAQSQTFKRGLTYSSSIMKKSCIKTLARREKISAKQVLMKYGFDLTTTQEEERRNKYGKNDIYRRVLKFPNITEFAERSAGRMEKNEAWKQMPNMERGKAKKKKKQEGAEFSEKFGEPNSISKNNMKMILDFIQRTRRGKELEQIFEHKVATRDPFVAVNINFRTGFQ